MCDSIKQCENEPVQPSVVFHIPGSPLSEFFKTLKKLAHEATPEAVEKMKELADEWDIK